MLKMIKIYFKRRNCNHDKYYETASCDAICCTCGLNLGFISGSREKYPHGEQYRGQPFYPRNGQNNNLI